MNVAIDDVIRGCIAAMGDDYVLWSATHEKIMIEGKIRKALESYVKHHGLLEVPAIPQAEGVAGK